MKKLQLIFILFIIMTSCGKKEMKSNILSKSAIENFYQYGDLHNQYLENIVKNFNEIDVHDYEKAITYLAKQHLSFSPNTSLNLELETYFNDIEFLNKFSHPRNLYDYAFSEDYSNHLELLRQSGEINNWEKQFIFELINDIEVVGSFTELSDYIDQKILEWELMEFDSNNGKISGIVLAIGRKSTDWWLENEQFYSNDVFNKDVNTRVLPAWLAADLVGAGVGIVIAATAYYVDNGTIEGCCSDGAATGALAAAIVGSTGIVGTVGRWLSSIM